MARLVGRVAPGQVAPGSAGAQDPEDAVEHVPRVPPRSAPPVLSARRLWDERSQNPPLLVGKVHALSLLSRETTRGPLYAATHVYEIASNQIHDHYIADRRLGGREQKPSLVLNESNNDAYIRHVVEESPVDAIVEELAFLSRYDPNRALLEAA